jgi:hypothetical protein
MTFGAFLERSGLFPFLCQVSVAILTFLVIGILQFWNFSLFFQRIVARLAGLDRVALLPDVLAVFIVVMARRTRNFIVHLMFLVIENHGAFLVLLISRILDSDLLRNISRNENAHREKQQAGQRGHQYRQKSLVHVRFHLLSLGSLITWHYDRNIQKSRSKCQVH